MNSYPVFEEQFHKIDSRLERIETAIAGWENATPWLTGDAVLRMLSISKRTLQNYRDRGLIGFSQIGNKLYYRRSEVLDLIERHYHAPY